MSPPVQPLIAVNGLLCGQERPRLELALRYAEALTDAGALPVAVGPVGGAAQLAALVERIDGVLLTGGDDFDTERLGLGPTHEEATPTPARKQDWDFRLARAALAKEVPVLGICYGMQVLGLAEGGRMHQHLPEDRPGCQEHGGGVVHGVIVERGSKLGQLLGVDEVDVISRHHQALAAVGPSWRVGARDEQGLIEAIEHEEHAFAVGVQWHPELSPSDSPHGGLFAGLVEAAARRAGERPFARDDRFTHDMDAVTWRDEAGNAIDPNTGDPLPR